jgi:flagellar M-ring protein FliF
MNQQIAQILKQLQAIWAQLGLNQRITIAAATVAVLVGLGSLGFWSSRPSYSLLYGKLDESEAAKVVAFLDEAKVSYQVRGSGSIFVSADKVHSIRMQLASKGLPKGEGVGFEIFDRSNFGISDFVQRANYLRAVQGELARTIGQVDSIEMARVMIVMPENRLLISDKNKPTASVFVKVRGNAQLPQQNVNAIRFLVANSVEGLQPSHVSVVDNLGNVLSDSLEPDSAVGMTQTQLEIRKKLEQYLSKKAEGMLDTVLGAGNSVVRVAADINFDSMTREEVKFDPESQVKRIETTTDENTDSTNPSPSGVPGVTVNANGETNSLSTVSQNSNRTRKKVTSNQYEISKITSNLVQAAGSVSRLSAAVFVAAKTEGTGANRKTVTRTKEELDKIRKIVQSALGIQEGTQSTRKDEITLEEFPFNDQTTTELTTTLQKDQSRQFWIQMVQTAIYPILALAVLVVLLKLFKRAPDVDIPVGVPVGEGTTYVNGQTANATTNGKEGMSVRTPTGVVTVEVLNQLIRENPQNMTQAIRGWMTRGPNK